MGWMELSQGRFKQLKINTCSPLSSTIRGALNSTVRFWGDGVVATASLIKYSWPGINSRKCSYVFRNADVRSYKLSLFVTL